MESEKIKDFEQHRKSAVKKALTDFRDKLLDLSGRNRLLNYKHFERARQIRLIDASLKDIHEALLRSNKNKPINLLYLPTPEKEFDEKMGEAELAKQLGINPSFELQISSFTKTGGDSLQTLLIPDKYTRKLLQVNDDARISLQELGINTLYCALAFLEWYESDASDKPVLSPLLLHPIFMERKSGKGMYVYTIHQDDEETISNVTLAKRLYQDFALNVPEYQPHISIEEYLSAIQEAVKTKPRWKIRTFATIGTFNFARLAMYEDLTSVLNGEAFSKLPDNEVLIQFLAGKKDQQSNGLSTNELPEEAFQLSASPLLITNADSSQYAAVVEACKGSNLVIEGPPGTGKSQTITNIIAALLDQNKRVLFVAEKSAALNVVKSRLTECGLGDFCLELHSTKSNKSDVYDSIRNRLKIEKEVCAVSDRALSALKAKAEFIEGYINELTTPFGECKRSVHDMIWRRQRIALEIGKETAESLESVTIREFNSVSGDQFPSVSVLLRDWHSIRQTFFKNGYKQKDHPLAIICRCDISHQEISRLKQIIKTLPSLITKAEESSSCLRMLNPSILDNNVLDIYQASVSLAKLKDLYAIPQQEVIERLRKSDLTMVKSWISKRKLINESVKKVSSQLLQGAKNQLRELEHFLSYVVEQQHFFQVTDIKNLLTTRSIDESKLQRLNELNAFLNELQSILRFKYNESGELFDSLDAMKSVMRSTDPQTLYRRTEASMSIENAMELERFIDKMTEFKNSYSELSALYDLTRIKDIESLCEVAATLQDSSWSSFFSRKVIRARKQFRAICHSNSKVPNEIASEELARIYQFLKTYKVFEEESPWKQLLGHTFLGLDTDVETVKNLLRLARELNTELSYKGDFSHRLLQFIQKAPMDSLDSLLRLVEPSKLTQLKTTWNELEGIPLEEARRVLEWRINCVKEYLEIWPKDLLENLSHLELLELYSIVSGLNSSEIERNENNNLIDLIPNGDDQTISSIEDALYYITTICDKAKLAESQISLANPKDESAIAKTDSSSTKESYEPLIACLKEFQEITGCTQYNLVSRSNSSLCLLFKQIEEFIDDIRDWIMLQRLHKQIIEHGLDDFIDQYVSLDREDLPIDLCFEYIALKELLEQAFSRSLNLGEVSGQLLSNARKDFSSKDRELIELNRKNLRNKLIDIRVSWGNGFGLRSTWTDIALINLEIAKRTKHLPIRKLMQRAGKALQQLKPCFMMSPLSVSQFIPLGGIEFDVVIIDEASQMRPEDAIGAILRGKQIIVVGDPKQLPPTSFFDREEHSDEDDEDSIDTESILDLALQQFGRPRRLLWHYRSSCAGLIAFSNQQFYDNELMLFPAAGSKRSSVISHHVQGQYHSQVRVNPIEAKAVAQAAVSFMLDTPESSLGIVALNSAQKEMINNELEMLMRENPKIAEYQERWENTIEPFIVKNLETIQGDERDVIFISTVYGPDQQGCMYQRFGPINSEFGWRRLNVLFTRAKNRVEVFTSMHPDDIKVDDQTSRGGRALRDYLEYAKSAQLPSGVTTGRPHDSDFEISIASVVQSAGYNIEPQVGVSGFFIDIGVLDPQNSRGFLVGIECDGKTYHSSRSARDRDRLREEILYKLGWRLIRIWSTDWFANPRREAIKLIEQIRMIEEERRKSDA